MTQVRLPQAGKTYNTLFRNSLDTLKKQYKADGRMLTADS